MKQKNKITLIKVLPVLLLLAGLVVLVILINNKLINRVPMETWEQVFINWYFSLTPVACVLYLIFIMRKDGRP